MVIYTYDYRNSGLKEYLMLKRPQMTVKQQQTEFILAIMQPDIEVGTKSFEVEVFFLSQDLSSLPFITPSTRP